MKSITVEELANMSVDDLVEVAEPVLVVAEGVPIAVLVNPSWYYLTLSISDSGCRIEEVSGWQN